MAVVLQNERDGSAALDDSTIVQLDRVLDRPSHKSHGAIGALPLGRPRVGHHKRFDRFELRPDVVLPVFAPGAFDTPRFEDQ